MVINIKGIFRKFLLLLVIGFISVGTIGGCSDNNGGTSTRAITENDFARDEGLRASTGGGVIVTFLEHPDSGADDTDTNGTGADEIPLTYSQTTLQTFCWEDDNADAAHFMELMDSEGSVVLRVDANGECATEMVEAGDHLMVINHDGIVDRSLPIFIIPSEDGLAKAQEKKGLRAIANNIFEGIQNKVVIDAQAQSAQDRDTLISTNKCENCDLQEAELSDEDLTGADLAGANLSGASLNEAILESADLTMATLLDANMDRADLSNLTSFLTDFRTATLTNAVMTTADLEGANFTSSNLSNADLSGAFLKNGALFGANLNSANFSGATMNLASLASSNLSNADLSGADLSDASFLDATLSNTDLTDGILSRAEWCDGCRCDDPSTGECSGCSSPDDVCN